MRARVWRPMTLPHKSDHEAVEVAKPGDQMGLTVIEHAREHDAVFKVT